MSYRRIAFWPLVASGIAPLAFATPTVTLNSLGGFSFDFGGHTFTARTRLSAPNGAWVDSQGASSVIGNVVTWNTPNFKITRTITPTPTRIIVEDQIQNTGTELAGMMVQNSLGTDVAPDNEYLAGKSITGDGARYNPANPSVFATFGQSGVGLVAEDDVYRAQGLVAVNAKCGLQLLDNSFGLCGGRKTTFRWSIYPTASGDFWDFTNQVRRDWDVNYTLRGPFTYEPGIFTYYELKNPKPADYYKTWAKQRGLGFITSGFIKFPDGTNALGTGVTYAADSLNATLSWMDKLSVAWGSSTGGGGVTGPSSGSGGCGGGGDDNGDDHDGHGGGEDGDGHDHGGGSGGGGDHEHHHNRVHTSALLWFHGQISTEPGADAKYADARAYDGDGNPINYLSAQYYPLFVPTLGNTYGKALKATVASLIGKKGFGGLYWDEMSYSYPELSSQGFVYGKGWFWDGTSVDIDPVTHAVKNHKVCVALASQGFQLEVLEMLRHANKRLVANTEPFTKTMTDLHFPRFIEAKAGDFGSALLGSPLALGNGKVELTPADALANAVSIINQGVLYFGWVERWTPNTPDFNQLCFPITPVDLRPGTITGRERIITTKSGDFGFPGGAKAKVVVFDSTANGGLVNLTPTKVHGVNLYHVDVPTGGLAVLVRR